jgi:hypothetical protein
MKRPPNKSAPRRPLVLARETVALLTPVQLVEVAGGSITNLTTRTETEIGG